MRETIGIGVVTHGRPDLFRECIGGIPSGHTLVVVNDGTPYPADLYPPRITRVIEHERPRGVAPSKNDALEFLLNRGCRHIFLSEDDVRITNPGVLEAYIRASERSGILHLNFGYHGPRNKTADGRPDPRTNMEYGDGIRIGFNRHLVGAFSYYHADVLGTVGLLDERFGNALDHVEHTYRIIRAGFHPAFWWFADVAESWTMIEDLDPDLRHSVLKSESWGMRLAFHVSNLKFRLKHGTFVQAIPEVSLEGLHESLDPTRPSPRGRHNA